MLKYCTFSLVTTLEIYRTYFQRKFTVNLFLQNKKNYSEHNLFGNEIVLLNSMLMTLFRYLLVLPAAFSKAAAKCLEDHHILHFCEYQCLIFFFKAVFKRQKLTRLRSV